MFLDQKILLKSCKLRGRDACTRRRRHLAGFWLDFGSILGAEMGPGAHRKGHLCDVRRTRYAKNLLDLKNKKLIAFAGIGNPKNFFDFLKLNQLNIVKEISYPDHYQYTKKELDYLIELEKKYIAKLITTEKDSFRINPFFRKKFINPKRWF